MNAHLTAAVTIVHVALVVLLLGYLAARYGPLWGLLPGSIYTLAWLAVLVGRSDNERLK